MQSFRLESSTLRYDDVDAKLRANGKEAVTLQSSIFDVSADYFFDANKPKDELLAVEKFAQASESVSDSDLIENCILRNQAWGLLPGASALAVKTGMHIRGNPPRWGGFGADKSMSPQFPQVLGKCRRQGREVSPDWWDED